MFKEFVKTLADIGPLTELQYLTPELNYALET